MELHSICCWHVVIPARGDLALEVLQRSCLLRREHCTFPQPFSQPANFDLVLLDADRLLK